jgi:hypothetical protein
MASVKKSESHRIVIPEDFPILLIAGCALLVAVYFANFVKIEIRDDEVYMYYTGLALIFPDEITALSKKIIHALSAGGYGREQISVFEFRYEYRYNYLVSSTGIAACRLLLPVLGDYGGSIRTCFSHGMIATNLFVISLIVFAALRVRKHAFVVGMLVLLVVFFALTISGINLTDYRVSKVQNPFTYSVLSIIFFISPGIQFDMFGLSARSVFTAGLLATFMLRWDGRIRESYASVLLLSFVHSTYGGMVILMIVAIDGTTRPKIFTDRVLTGVMVATVALFFVRERIWSVYGGIEIAVFAVLLIILWIFAAYLIHRNSVTIRNKIQRINVIKLDIVLFLFGGLLISTIAYLMTDQNSLESRYTWMQLSSRPLALIRVPVFLGLIVLLVFFLSQLNSRLVATSARVLGALTLTVATIILVRTDLFQWSPSDEDAKLQALTQEVMQDGERSLPNILIYYHLLREIETDRSQLMAIIASEKPNGRKRPISKSD